MYDMNSCTFDGLVAQPPVYKDNVLYVTLAHQYGKDRYTEINLFATSTYAAMLYPKINKGDKIHVVCIFSPVRVNGIYSARFLIANLYYIFKSNPKTTLHYKNPDIK